MQKLDIDSTINRYIQKHGSNRDSLLPILRDVQKKYRHVSYEIMQILAEKLKIHAVEIQGVVSFYHFLSIKPKGQYIISLCQTLSCRMKGAMDVAKQLENDLGIRFGETTKDGMFSLQYTNCIGMCDHAPAMLVNETPYIDLDMQKMRDIIEKCRRDSQNMVDIDTEEHHE